MADTHEFRAGLNGRCTVVTEPGGDQCGRAKDADAHQVPPRPNPSGGSAPRPLSPGKRRQPWAELPAPSKAVVWVFGGCAAALLVCLVATACRLILSAGGWLG